MGEGKKKSVLGIHVACGEGRLVHTRSIAYQDGVGRYDRNGWVGWRKECNKSRERRMRTRTRIIITIITGTGRKSWMDPFNR